MGGATGPIGSLFHKLDNVDPVVKFLDKKGIKAPGNLLFPEAPKIPLAPVQEMPDPNDPALLLAKKRRIADSASRSGRQSTILSDTQDSLGG